MGGGNSSAARRMVWCLRESEVPMCYRAEEGQVSPEKTSQRLGRVLGSAEELGLDSGGSEESWKGFKWRPGAIR